MGKIKRYRNAVERFLAAERGQRFFNFAYSVGAAIVICGALFKIVHLPGDDILLCIGMGTEVLIFILNALDRPARDYDWEKVFPQLDGITPENPVTLPRAAAPIASRPVSGTTRLPEECLEGAESVAASLAQLQEAASRLAKVSAALTDSVSAISARASGLGEDAEGYARQMQDLNRNISGLNTIYEIQLRSVAGQLEAIENVNRGMKEIGAMYEDAVKRSRRYNEESEKLTRNMEQLNSVYANMLSAMTVNMPRGTASKES